MASTLGTLGTLFSPRKAVGDSSKLLATAVLNEGKANAKPFVRPTITECKQYLRELTEYAERIAAIKEEVAETDDLTASAKNTLINTRLQLDDLTSWRLAFERVALEKLKSDPRLFEAAPPPARASAKVPPDARTTVSRPWSSGEPSPASSCSRQIRSLSSAASAAVA